MSGPVEYGVPPLPYSLVEVGLIRGGPCTALAGSMIFGRPNGLGDRGIAIRGAIRIDSFYRAWPDSG